MSAPRRPYLESLNGHRCKQSVPDLLHRDALWLAFEPRSLKKLRIAYFGEPPKEHGMAVTLPLGRMAVLVQASSIH